MTAPSSPHDGSDAREFLTTILGQKDDALHVLIWRLRDKLSFWPRTVEHAIGIAETFSAEDVYLGVSLSPKDFGRKRRCAAADAAGLLALAIDIDVAGPAHQKPNLPPTIEAAAALITTDLLPTLTIHTGHGLQAWWVFKEPWIFDDEDARAAGAATAERSNRFFQHRARALGYDMDSTFDLARVYRIPGTTNTKIPGEPCPITILSRGGPMYDPSDITEYLDEAGAFLPPARVKGYPTAGVASVGGAFVLNPNANPPLEKFELLKELELDFSLSWEHRRRDLHDQSPSAYDMSLASYAARMRWTDQEIVDLLIAHRRKHGVDLKLRPDYFARTIAKARESADEYWKEEEADALIRSRIADDPGPPEATAGATGADATTVTDGVVADAEIAVEETPDSADAVADLRSSDGGSADPGRAGCSAPALVDSGTDDHSQGARAAAPLDPAVRRALLDALSIQLKIRIQRVVKFMGEPCSYRIETPTGAAQIPTVDGLINQSKLRRSLADLTGKYLRHIDPEDWPAFAQSLLDVCEPVDRGPDATTTGALTEHLRAYLSERPPHDCIEDAVESREPFRSGQAVGIFLDSFLSFLAMRRNERVPRLRLTADLRVLGANPQAVHAVLDGKETTRSVWMLPEGQWACEEAA